jgi:hypothetical protein
MAPRTGDKVDWPDSVAPLGTDDEAAGTPPPRERLKLAVRINDWKLDAPTRFYFVFIIALALVFIGFGLLASRP